jgi:hypothetical protein
MFECYLKSQPVSSEQAAIDVQAMITSVIKKLAAESNGELSARATLLQQYAHSGPSHTVEVLGPDGELIGNSCTAREGEVARKRKPRNRKAIAGAPRDVKVLPVDAEARVAYGGLHGEIQGRLSSMLEGDEGGTRAPADSGDELSEDLLDEEPVLPPATQAFGKSALASRLGGGSTLGKAKSIFHTESTFQLPSMTKEPLLDSHEAERSAALNEMDFNTLAAESSPKQPFQPRGDDEHAGSSLRRKAKQHTRRSSQEHETGKRRKLESDELFALSTKQSDGGGRTSNLFAEQLARRQGHSGTTGLHRPSAETWDAVAA